MKLERNGTIDGLLPIHKESGWTSHDVVAKARRLLGQKRIGHAGTLDPDVTGVLVLCIGKATRMVEYVQEQSKTYDAQLIFGKSTDTLDLSGSLQEEIAGLKLDPEQLNDVLNGFIGRIKQVPPMYSAIKVQGKKLYELARKGQEIERKPRDADIYHLQVNEYRLDQTFPEIQFTVSCSKGTYIRSLCEDIGKKLGVPAVMGKLVRTKTGPFELADSCSLGHLETAIANNRLDQWLKPTDLAVTHLPLRHVHHTAVWKAAQGQRLSEIDIMEDFQELDGLIRLYTPQKLFIGLYERSEDQLLQPRKIFITPDLLGTKGNLA